MANPPSKKEKETASNGKDLIELRQIIVGQERLKLDALRQRLDAYTIKAEEVSSVLPRAISIRAGEDRKLSAALAPTVERILQRSVEKNPQALVKALFPIMGPLIRKSVSAALRNMLESLNRTLDHSLSPKSIRWRLQSWQTGQPFSEIVMLHTLQYRIEQVFLIHRETGLTLAHVVADDVDSLDPSLVSAMLTALQDWVRDSFTVTDSEGLKELRIADLDVWIEEGPLAVIAAAIRGNAPGRIREDLQATLERIHVEQAAYLGDLPDDTAVFGASEPHLESCLQSQLKEESRKISPIFGGAMVLILFAVGTWGFLVIRENMRWRNFLGALEKTPGIVLTSVDKEGGMYHLSGLRDPLSPEPSELADAVGLDSSQLVQNWEPYQAQHPDFMATRAQWLLAAPDSVDFAVEETVLYARGHAPREWIEQAEKRVRFMPGITGFDQTQLRDSTGEEIVRQIESIQLLFAMGSSRLSQEEVRKMDELARNVRALDSWMTVANQSARIGIIGRTDATGSAATNAELSEDRARHILDLLAERRLISPRLEYVIQPQPAVAEDAEPNDLQRSVTLKLNLQEFTKAAER